MRGRGPLSADERRAAILDAAQRLFIQNGFETVRMGDVAAAAGVSRSLVYAHFPSTAAMLDELLARALDTLGQKLVTVLAHVTEEPAPAVRAVVRVLLESDDLLAVLFSGGSPEFHRSRRRQLAEHLRPIIDPYLHGPGAGPYDREILLILFEGIGLFIRAERPEDPDAVIENLAAFIQQGIKPRGPHPPSV